MSSEIALAGSPVSAPSPLPAKPAAAIPASTSRAAPRGRAARVYSARSRRSFTPRPGFPASDLVPYHLRYWAGQVLREYVLLPSGRTVKAAHLKAVVHCRLVGQAVGSLPQARRVVRISLAVEISDLLDAFAPPAPTTPTAKAI